MLQILTHRIADDDMREHVDVLQEKDDEIWLMNKHMRQIILIGLTYRMHTSRTAYQIHSIYLT